MAPPRQLNIGIATDFFFPRIGGVECHVFSLARTLVEMGHRVVVITGHLFPGRQGVRHLSTGVKVYHLPLAASYESNVTSTYFFSALATFRAVALRERLQLVHAHQPTSVLALEVAKHAKMLGLPTVLTYHSIWGPGELTTLMIDYCTSLCRTFIDKSICVSHACKDAVMLSLDVEPDDIFVVPNGVDYNHFRPIEGLAPDPNKELHVILLSRLNYRKGIEIAIEIIPKICAKYKHVRFNIVGEGPYKIELLEMLKIHLLHSQVNIQNGISYADVPNKLCQNHVFLNCALTESFGLAVLEALFCGLKVVTTNVGGIREIMPEGVMYRCEPTAESVSKALEYVIENYSALRPRPASEVTQAFDNKNVTKRTLAVYEAAMASKKKSLLEYVKGRTWMEQFTAATILVIEMVLIFVLDWLDPPSGVEEAVDYSEAWRERIAVQKGGG